MPVREGMLPGYLITFPSTALREAILRTGMTKGMEASYARLEGEMLAA